jgi:magnesium and cobalt transporter
MPEPEPKTQVKKSGIVSKLWKACRRIFLDRDYLHEALKELKARAKKMSREEKNILTNFIKFGQREVRDVMIHRTDVSALNAKSSMNEISKAIASQTHTRTPIYKDNLDNIIGFVHVKDLYKVLVSSKKTTIKDIIRQHLITTPSTKLIDLLVIMRRRRTHMAIVVDEYGSTEGILTIEDVIEEIVGEMEDEHDCNGSNPDFEVVQDNVIITHARVEIEEIAKVLDIELKSEDEGVDTIGGLVMMRCGHVPKRGEIINLSENITAEVLDSNPRTLKKLKITYRELEEE